MSEYFNPRRTRNLYNSDGAEPFRISRSKIDLFLNCQLCFYLDRKLGVGRPPGFPFNLNSAVDTLLKKEFDIHRAAHSSHPLMDAYGLKDVVPYADSRMDAWRDALKRGVTFVHKATNFLVTGGVDDILNKIDIAGESGGTITINGGSNSTPSAAGLTSIGNLVGKSWTVNYNP